MFFNDLHRRLNICKIKFFLSKQGISDVSQIKLGNNSLSPVEFSAFFHMIDQFGIYFYLILIFLYFLNTFSIFFSAGMNESTDLSVLKVYFPETDSVLYKTDVLFSWYDIISDYGGILSLCLGCSIISFFELFFYITIRFYQNLFNSVNFLSKFQRQKPNVFDNKAFHRAKFDYIHQINGTFYLLYRDYGFYFFFYQIKN